MLRRQGVWVPGFRARAVRSAAPGSVTPVRALAAHRSRCASISGPRASSPLIAATFPAWVVFVRPACRPAWPTMQPVPRPQPAAAAPVPPACAFRSMSGARPPATPARAAPNAAPIFARTEPVRCRHRTAPRPAMSATAAATAAQVCATRAAREPQACARNCPPPVPVAAPRTAPCVATAPTAVAPCACPSPAPA